MAAYIQAVDNGTTIVVTCSENEITFTKATAHALILQKNSTRVVIREDYYLWTITDNRMIRFRHDTGATTTGMSGNNYSAVQISGELYWYPLTSYENTNESAITAQLQDFAMQTNPNKGSWVDDLILFENFGSEGVGADSAWHIEPDINDEAKTTLDRARIRPAIIIHDWPFQYGSVESPTSILLNHLKLDDNAANNSLSGEVGPDGSWHAVSDGSARNTNATGDSVQVDNFRGRALDTQDGTGYGQLAIGAGTVHNNAFLLKGAMLIKLTPQFGYNDAANQVIFDLYQGTNDSIILRYNSSSDDFELIPKWGGSSITLDTVAFTENYSLQRQINLLASWDSDKDFGLFALDGRIIEVGRNTGSPTSSEPSAFNIGALNDRSTPGDYIIDEIKTFSEAILPYGAFYVGNGEGFLADISNPHKDLIFFWDAQSVNAKGGADLASDITGTLGSANTGSTTSFPTSGGIVGGYFDNESYAANYYIRFPISSQDIFKTSGGAMGVWFSVSHFENDDYVFGWFGNVSNYWGLQTKTSGQNLQYDSIQGGNTQFILTTQGFATDQIIYALLKWRNLDTTSGVIELYINGVLIDTKTHSAANAAMGGYLYFASVSGSSGYSCDCNIYRAFITDNPDTPEIWTAMGKPLHLPLIYKQ